MEQVAPVETTSSPVDQNIKTELDQQMAISLNGGVLPTANEGVSAQQESAPAPAADPFGVFKEKFGYDSPEAAIQDIEALRAFRASPPPAEIKFENDLSKQVAQALQAGKMKEVYDVLHQQMQIDRLTGGEVNDDMATEIVKYGMQLKYKDLSPAEINYKFNKQFGLPPKPALQQGEDQEEYDARVATWQSIVDDRKMELTIEAKTMRPDLAAAKSKLVFPTISRPQEQEFQEWQKNVQENEALASETTAAYKAFTPKSLETKLNFKDDPNKINFDYTYEPDPQSFAKTIEMCSDIELFWQSFIAPDGKPDRVRFAKALHAGMNLEKIVLDAMIQAKNATIKAMLPDNSTGGIVRQLPQGNEEKDWLRANMEASLKGYGPF